MTEAYPCAADYIHLNLGNAAAEGGYAFPQLHFSADAMAALSLAMAQQAGAAFCCLPFCHTVQAEALGGLIVLGDGVHGPRARDMRYTTLAQLAQLPQTDFEAGRIGAVLQAAELLAGQGQAVALEVCGPFTVLNGLLPLAEVARALRRSPESLEPLFLHLERQALEYIGLAVQKGVRIISWADPAGDVAFLGPKRAALLAQRYTIPLVRRAMALCGGNAALHLCPKTAHFLASAGLGHWASVEVAQGVGYGHACLAQAGAPVLLGERCVRSQEKLDSRAGLRQLVLH